MFIIPFYLNLFKFFSDWLWLVYYFGLRSLRAKYLVNPDASLGLILTLVKGDSISGLKGPIEPN